MRVSPIEPGRSADLASAVLAVQRAAYRLEATLIGDDRIPALHETTEELRRAPLQWLGAFGVDGRLLGAIAWTEQADGLDIDRLVVRPTEHRRGVGTALVQAVLDRAGARPTSVSTGRANTPALELYRGLGFAAYEEVEVLPTLWITRLTRTQGDRSSARNALRVDPRRRRLAPAVTWTNGRQRGWTRGTVSRWVGPASSLPA